MSRMSMPPMMLPMAMQQQLQMSMMAPMGMGLGMGMDMNNINRSNITGISPVLHPTASMPMTSWDAGSGDRIQATSPAVMADPFSTFLAGQSQVNTCWILCWQFSHSLTFSTLSFFFFFWFQKDFAFVCFFFGFSYSDWKEPRFIMFNNSDWVIFCILISIRTSKIIFNLALRSAYFAKMMTKY